MLLLLLLPHSNLKSRLIRYRIVSGWRLRMLRKIIHFGSLKLEFECKDRSGPKPPTGGAELDGDESPSARDQEHSCCLSAFYLARSILSLLPALVPGSDGMGAAGRAQQSTQGCGISSCCWFCHQRNHRCHSLNTLPWLKIKHQAGRENVSF